MTKTIHYVLKHGKYGYLARHNHNVVDVQFVEEAYWFESIDDANAVREDMPDKECIVICVVTVEELA